MTPLPSVTMTNLAEGTEGRRSSVETRIGDAIAKLRALRQGDRAVIELTACGEPAIEPLRAFLFAREPSGLFEPRCLAVEALAALGAKEVLCDFLAQLRAVADPVEQTGEEAVANAVARALARWPGDDVFALLLTVGARRSLSGVVETLGQYRRPAAIPVFAAALSEDFCRPAAEEAFRRLGAVACPCLLRLADRRSPTVEAESESSRRRRRSALGLLAEVLPGDGVPEVVRSLIADADTRISFLACSVCLPRLRGVERDGVVERLVELLAGADWVLANEVEDLLVAAGETAAAARSPADRL